MTERRAYFGVVNIALNDTRRDQFIDALKALGANNLDPNPAFRNHWRVRTDRQAVIFEAKYNTESLTVAALKVWLANVFSISPDAIDAVTQANAYGIMATFSRLGVDYVRIQFFGWNGGWPTYEESQDAALTYLAANAAAWGDVV